MGLFSIFFKPGKHNNFEYKPRFYDAEAEERKRKLEILRARKNPEKEITNDDYIPGDIIKRGFITNNSKKKRKKFSYITIAILIVIIFIAIYLLYTEDYEKIISIFF